MTFNFFSLTAGFSIEGHKYYAISIDEATDISNSEQVVIVLRWVDDSLSVHEGFTKQIQPLQLH